MKKKYRNLKTSLLALAACGAFIYSAIYTWGVPKEEIWEMFLMSLLMIGSIALIAGVFVLVMNWLRKN